MPGAVRFAALAAVVAVAACQPRPTAAPAQVHSPWAIKLGLRRTDYLGGGSADVSCIGPQTYTYRPGWTEHGCTVLHDEARSDGSLVEARCQTDFKPNLIRTEMRATGDNLVEVSFSQKTEGVAEPWETEHQRLTFVGACPAGWRVGDWLELRPEDGRWRVRREPQFEGRIPPDPIVVVEYRRLPPELARLFPQR
jgi:hypothetical protein